MLVQYHLISGPSRQLSGRTWPQLCSEDVGIDLAMYLEGNWTVFKKQFWAPEGKRRRGRPKLTWRQIVEAKIKVKKRSWDTLQKQGRERKVWITLVTALYTKGVTGNKKVSIPSIPTSSLLMENIIVNIKENVPQLPFDA